jgi:4'-phosphopantetheinyl transferase
MLRPDQIHVWHRQTDSMCESALARARALLSPDERSRHDALRHGRDRRDYAAAHALLRTSLSRYGGPEPCAWTFKAGPHGKPDISSPLDPAMPLTFNVSHAPGLVACAIAPGDAVGIDVEDTAARFDCWPVASRYFSPDEITQLEISPPQGRFARFIELWTLKEAYGKATGQGSTVLSDCSFRIDDDRIHFAPPAGAVPGGWQFALFAVQPSFRMAVAIFHGDSRPRKITASSAVEDDASRVDAHIVALQPGSPELLATSPVSTFEQP